MHQTPFQNPCWPGPKPPNDLLTSYRAQEMNFDFTTLTPLVFSYPASVPAFSSKLPALTLTYTSPHRSSQPPSRMLSLKALFVMPRDESLVMILPVSRWWPTFWSSFRTSQVPPAVGTSCHSSSQWNPLCPSVEFCKVIPPHFLSWFPEHLVTVFTDFVPPTTSLGPFCMVPACFTADPSLRGQCHCRHLSWP